MPFDDNASLGGDELRFLGAVGPSLRVGLHLRRSYHGVDDSVGQIHGLFGKPVKVLGNRFKEFPKRRRVSRLNDQVPLDGRVAK